MFRRNEQIHISPIRVIDENGKQLGIMPTSKALSLARQKGLDLIEVASNTRPPVCRITEWSKFKYDQSKKRKSKKKEDIKEMQFTALTAEGDIQHKLKNILKFLDKGKIVKIVVKTPRRINTKMSEELTQKVLEKIKKITTIEIVQPTRIEGFYVTTVIKKA